MGDAAVEVDRNIGSIVSPVGAAIADAAQPKGRESGARGYKVAEHIAILNAYKDTPGSLAAGSKSSLVDSVIVKIKTNMIEFNRPKKALHDHVTEMMSNVKSAIMTLSAKPTPVNCPSYDKFIAEDMSGFCDSLFTELMSSSEKYGSASWWNPEVAKICTEMILKSQFDTGASRGQTTADIAAEAAENKRKFDAERDAKAEELKRRKEEEAEDNKERKENAKRFIQFQAENSSTMKTICASIDRMASAGAHDPRITALETEVAGIKTEVALVKTEVTSVKEAIKETKKNVDDGIAAILARLGPGPA